MSIREFSHDELEALWESGIPLDSAWIEFSATLDRFALQALRTHPANDPDVLARNPRYEQLCKGWLPPTWEGRQKKLEIVTRTERLNLLDEIYGRRLWAIGFRTLASGFDLPVWVPRRLFLVQHSEGDPETKPDIDWNREELRDGEVRYFNIHILRPPAVSESAGVPEPEQHSESAADQPKPNNGPQAVEDAQRPATSAAIPADDDAPKGPRAIDEAKPAEQARGDMAEHTAISKKTRRPNKRQEIRRKVEEMWGDPLFQGIPRRIDQAREVRARLLGEETRFLDEMVGYGTPFITRIIGEVANQHRSPGETA